MKKIFTFVAAAAMSLAAIANDYAGNITVLINNQGATQETTITITQNEDETYCLSIKNFKLSNEETTIDINGLTTVVADQVIQIQEGDDPNVSMWYGPFLGDVPIIMTAQFDDTKAKADIDIDMRTILQQFINVKFETPGYSGKYGDVNGDGNVTANDVTAVYNVILGQ